MAKLKAECVGVAEAKTGARNDLLNKAAFLVGQMRVGEQVMYWDDGAEQNTYVVGLGSTLASHFKFTGQATISPGWYAGYVIHVEAISSDSLTISQNVPVGPAILAGAGGGVPGYQTQLLQSFWFIKSDHLGKVGVGLQSQASDNTAILVDGSGSLVPANWVAFEYRAFFARSSTGALSTAALGLVGACTGGGANGDCNGATQHVVRYDSPTFGGFSVSASWGEDDMWDVAARYAGEWNGIKLAVAAAYNELSGGALGPSLVPLGPVADTEEYFQVGAYIEHVPTGIFLYGAYGNNQREISAGEAETYYVKAGLRERWTPLGHTVLYGEYENVQADGAAFVQLNGIAGLGAAPSADLDLWGLGVVQEIDAAAMSIWLSYRNIEYSDSSTVDFDEFQYIKAGALINF